MCGSPQADKAVRFLCLSLTACLLTACNRSPQAKVNSEEREIRELLEATRNNPSLQPGSNLAGHAIHVDAYPPSAGMKHHDREEHQTAKH